MMGWLWLIPAVVLPVAVAMLWFGLRGRRVDDHPLCRKCGFDLFGRPETSSVCSECGADLTKPRAIRIGRRQRHAGLIAAGVMLLVIALGVGGAAARAHVDRAMLRRAKPDWWVLREIGSKDHPTAVVAAGELTVRLGSDRLSQKTIAVAADRILAIQADRNAKWNAIFGDFIESALLAGKLSDQRFQKYAQGSAVFAIDVRPRVNRGDPLPFWIVVADARVGSRMLLDVQYQGSYEIDDGMTIPGRMSGSNTLQPYTRNATAMTLDLARAAAQLADGPHTAHVVLSQRVFRRDIVAGGPVTSTKYKLSAPFQVLPAEQPAVAIIRDESLRSAVEAAIGVDSAASGGRSKGEPSHVLGIRVHVRKPPVDVGFDVFVVIDGQEHPAGSIAAPGNATGARGQYMSVMLPQPFTSDKIDVLFKPSVEAAKRTTDVSGIWDGVIRKRNVPLTHPRKPTTTPVDAGARS